MNLELKDIVIDKKIEEHYNRFTYSNLPITNYRIFRTICKKLEVEDYKELNVDFDGDDVKIELIVTKEKIIEAIKEAKKLKNKADYEIGYIDLQDKIDIQGEVGFKIIRYLIGTPIDPKILENYLPEKELLKKDYQLWNKLITLSCGYYATDEGLLSLELAKQLALGKSLDNYPELLVYHYYHHPSTEKQVCNVPFTKSEFLESVRKRQKNKKLIRK